MRNLILILIMFIGIYGYSQNSINLNKPNNYGTIEADSVSADNYSIGGWQLGDITNVLYVDGSNTSTVTGTGTLIKPFTTIQACTEYMNADALALAVAGNYPESKYIVKIAPGTYADTLLITNQKYVRFQMAGVKITGKIDIQTTQQTADYYSKIEFWGGMSNRPEKGDNGEISGIITCTRNNDALQYMSFTGMEISNNLLFTTNGTWVVFLNHAYFSNGSAFISGDFAGAGVPTVLLESVGKTRIKAHITDTDASSTNIALYDCSETEFDLINSHSTFGGMIKNCIFKSNVTISAGTYKIDNVSYKQIEAQTETLAGATITYMDSYNGGKVDIVGNLTVTNTPEVASPDSAYTQTATGELGMTATVSTTDLTGNIGNSTTAIDTLFSDVAHIQLLNYGLDAVGTDAYAITITGLTATTGTIIVFKANVANTGACSLNVNGGGVVSLKAYSDQDPPDNYIEAASMVMVAFDGTNYQILSPDCNP